MQMENETTHYLIHNVAVIHGKRGNGEDTIEVYGDLAYDCTKFSEKGLEMFIDWVKKNKPFVWQKVANGGS